MGLRRSPFHILDMSWTSLLMRTGTGAEQDTRLLHYAEDYARSLLRVQFEDQFSRMAVGNLKPMEYLNDLRKLPVSNISFEAVSHHKK